MSKLIGLIVKYVIDFINEFLSALKLQNLENELREKKEAAIESSTTATNNYTDFNTEYEAWLHSGSDVSRTTPEVRPSIKKSANSNPKIRGRTPGKRGRNRRAKSAARRLKGQAKSGAKK